MENMAFVLFISERVGYFGLFVVCLVFVVVFIIYYLFFNF